MTAQEYLRSKGVEVTHQISIMKMGNYKEIARVERPGSGIQHTLFANKKDLERLTRDELCDLVNYQFEYEEGM